MSDYLFKDEFLNVINDFGLSKDDICLVGGTVLSLHNLRPNTDVDFLVRDKVLKNLLFDNGRIGNLQVVRNIILTSEHTDIHVGRFQNIGLSDNEIIGNPRYHQVIDGFKVNRLEIEFVDRIFVKYPKRKKDVILIKNNYQNIPNWDWELVIDLLLTRKEHIMLDEIMIHSRAAELRALASNLQEANLVLQSLTFDRRLKKLLKKIKNKLRRVVRGN